MSVLSTTPHTVLQKRPDRPRDPDTNATELDYGNPTKEENIKGLFQSRGGVKSITDEGENIPFDAMFYTLVTDVADDDLLVVDLGWVAGNFVVVSVEPKPDLDGVFDHTEVLLRKDTRI